MRPLPLLAAAYLFLPPLAAAQTSAHPHYADTGKALPSPATQWFEQLKQAAGTWQGGVTTDPASRQMTADVVTVTMGVTSMGNALMHSMPSSRRPHDPITMICVEDGKLMLTHSCDSGNRPRMEAKFSAVGKTASFELMDIEGPSQRGVMNRAVFAMVDAEHHTQEWTYAMPNGVEVRVRSDLQRTSPSR